MAKESIGLLKQTFSDFMEDECPRMAAALSYYTVFSLPPILVLVLVIVGAVFDPADVRGGLETQMGQLIGPGGAEQVRSIIDEAQDPGAGRGLAAVIGIGALLFGATGAFVELQNALNRAWEVQPDPNQGGIKTMVVKRIFSLGMVLVIAFLLLVSLVLSAFLAGFGEVIAGYLGGLSDVVLQVMNFGVSFLVITLLFAAIFKILPDARIAWRDVWVGAAVTALLFVAGKFAIGLYLGNSNPGEAYGAAGSLAVLLVWIYYSSMILLLGAEFTQVWAERKGSGIEPEEGAVRVEKPSPQAVAREAAARKRPG